MRTLNAPSRAGLPSSRQPTDAASSLLVRPDEDLLHDGGHEAAVDVMDGALDESPVAEDGDGLLGVEVPPVEPRRAVEPDDVVEAEPREGAWTRQLGM